HEEKHRRHTQGHECGADGLDEIGMDANRIERHAAGIRYAIDDEPAERLDGLTNRRRRDAMTGAEHDLKRIVVQILQRSRVGVWLIHVWALPDRKTEDEIRTHDTDDRVRIRPDSERTSDDVGTRAEALPHRV